MTANDFLLLSIAFGGFLIFAVVLWGGARIADRKQNERRSPDVSPDIDSASASDGHGRREATRSEPSNDVLHRLTG